MINGWHSTQREEEKTRRCFAKERNLFEIVYLHCLSIEKEEEEEEKIAFIVFFCLLGIIVTSNRIYTARDEEREKKKSISFPLSSSNVRSLLFFFSLRRFFYQLRKIFVEISTFSLSLCLIKLCVNCVRFHPTSLSL